MKYIYDVEQEDIKAVINSGDGELVEAELCEKFDEYISHAYPWQPVFGYRIEWNLVKDNHKRFNWEHANDEEVRNFIKGTCINNYQEVCFMYGAREPGIAVKLDYVLNDIRKFENLAIIGIQTNFMVGVKRDQYGLIHLDHECFIEVYNNEWLTASK